MSKEQREVCLKELKEHGISYGDMVIYEDNIFVIQVNDWTGLLVIDGPTGQENISNLNLNKLRLATSYEIENMPSEW